MIDSSSCLFCLELVKNLRFCLEDFVICLIYGFRLRLIPEKVKEGGFYI